MPPRPQLVLAMLGALGPVSACTSEAQLGYWRATPLANGDAAVIPSGDGDGDADHDGAIDEHAPPAPDGGFVHRSPLCLRNPSLDGIPHGGPLEPQTWWIPEAWDICFNDPEDFPDPTMVATTLCGITVVNEATTIDAKDGMPAAAGALPPPTHGVGYLHLDNLRGLPERTSQPLCAELEPGVTYNFAIDLASRIGQTHEGVVLNTAVLDIYGGNVACGHAGEPLWRSPPLTSDWKTYCVSITPVERVSILTLEMPAKDRPKSAVLIDNIRLSETCGPAVD